jgi:hypothetical protein
MIDQKHIALFHEQLKVAEVKHFKEIELPKQTYQEVEKNQTKINRVHLSQSSWKTEIYVRK